MFFLTHHPPTDAHNQLSAIEIFDPRYNVIRIATRETARPDAVPAPREEQQGHRSAHDVAHTAVIA